MAAGSIGVGMLGYAFMRKAQSHAFHDVQLLDTVLENAPEPVSVCVADGHGPRLDARQAIGRVGLDLE
jgi:hypothetical protein